MRKTSCINNIPRIANCCGTFGFDPTCCSVLRNFFAVWFNLTAVFKMPAAKSYDSRRCLCFRLLARIKKLGWKIKKLNGCFYYFFLSPQQTKYQTGRHFFLINMQLTDLATQKPCSNLYSNIMLNFSLTTFYRGAVKYVKASGLYVFVIFKKILGNASLGPFLKGKNQSSFWTLNREFTVPYDKPLVAFVALPLMPNLK